MSENTKKTRSSSMVRLCIVGMAALTAACVEDDRAHVKDCVDEHGIVVPERLCQGKLPDAGAMTDAERTYYQTVIVPRGPTYVPVYRWHYDDVYVPVGNHIWGGSYVASPAVEYTPSSAFRGSVPGAVSISRGGFGAVGRSFSFGAGE